MAVSVKESVSTKTADRFDNSTNYSARNNLVVLLVEWIWCGRRDLNSRITPRGAISRVISVPQAVPCAYGRLRS